MKWPSRAESDREAGRISRDQRWKFGLGWVDDGVRSSRVFSSRAPRAALESPASAHAATALAANSPAIGAMATTGSRAMAAAPAPAATPSVTAYAHAVGVRASGTSWCVLERRIGRLLNEGAASPRANPAGGSRQATMTIVSDPGAATPSTFMSEAAASAAKPAMTATAISHPPTATSGTSQRSRTSFIPALPHRQPPQRLLLRAGANVGGSTGKAPQHLAGDPTSPEPLSGVCRWRL